MLTDVAGVLAELNSPGSVVARATPAELRSMRLPVGSMGPKAEAASRFVESTGRRAAIGALDDAAMVIAGKCGTQVGPISH